MNEADKRSVADVLNAGRSAYLDVVKGLGILLVIAGHSMQYGMGTGYTRFWNLPLYKFIYSFHMPLFMAISGWLFWVSYSRHGGVKVLACRCKSLFYPIFVYGVVASLPTIVKSPESFSVHEAFFKDHLWFFWSILIATSIAIFMFQLNKRCLFNEWGFIGLLFIGMMMFSDDWLIAPHKFVLPYFLMGGVICKLQLDKKIKNLWVTIPLYVLCLSFYRSDTYIYVSMYSIVREGAMQHLWIDVYRFVTGLFGTVSFLLFVRYACNTLSMWSGGVDAIAWLGRNTLFIYFIQGLLFATLSRITMPYWGWWQPCTTFILVVIISIVFVLIVRHFSVISYLLFGQDYTRNK